MEISQAVDENCRGEELRDAVGGIGMDVISPISKDSTGKLWLM
jgi:hypothetical protein